MVRSKKLLIIAFSLLAALGVVALTFPFTKTVRTENKKAAWFQSQLRNDVTWHAFDQGAMQVRVKGFCRNRLTDDPNQTVVVQVGNRFCERPDHHGGSWMLLEKISEGRATIRYFTTFNHSSFGKRLIETDEGSFEWP